MLVRRKLENCGGKLAWFRIFFPYGAGDKSSRLLPTLHKVNAGLIPPITVDKSSVRDFVHVNDIAEAFKCLVSGNCDGIFNLCSGTAVSIGDLVDAVAACYNKPVNIRSSEKSQKIERIVGDFTALSSEGWFPTFKILERQREFMLC